MSYVDVIFPLSLGPLTYRCPEGMAESALPGMLVSAPIKKSLTKGIILRKTLSTPAGRIRELDMIHGDTPLLSGKMLKLLLWMADYYIASEGIILKQTVPQEVFVKTKARKGRDRAEEPQGI
ncbi:MAG: hypothetical protein HZA17_02335, partial [Nitrospirae bacterium]|nr:hypothetical protein [Nitrospirota bacterium]